MPDPAANSKIYPDHLLRPPVLCPVCGHMVCGFAGSQDAPPVASAVAPLRRQPTPRGPRIQVETIWRLFPCYCEVSAYWASAFAAELRDRERGAAPRSVAERYETYREAERARIEGHLRELYTARDRVRGGRGAPAIVASIEEQIQRQIRQMQLMYPEYEHHEPEEPKPAKGQPKDAALPKDPGPREEFNNAIAPPRKRLVDRPGYDKSQD